MALWRPETSGWHVPRYSEGVESLHPSGVRNDLRAVGTRQGRHLFRAPFRKILPIPRRPYC